jgi:hypothetical protein
MPNPSGQMAPNMPARPPMVPYGVLTGQPPQPGAMPMQQNPGGPPPGQMLPPAPGVPATPPAGTQFPGQPGQQGTPLGRITPPSNVQPVSGPSMPQPSQGRPTLSELAAQSSNGSSSGATAPAGSR